MELLYASPCITAVICFSLEKRCLDKGKIGGQGWIPTVRVAARGKATTFPLPLGQLEQQPQERRNEAAVPLPQKGEDLKGVVSVILKASDADHNAESMSGFVHQATVRRHGRSRRQGTTRTSTATTRTIAPLLPLTVKQPLQLPTSYC